MFFRDFSWFLGTPQGTPEMRKNTSTDVFFLISRQDLAGSWQDLVGPAHVPGRDWPPGAVSMAHTWVTRYVETKCVVVRNLDCPLMTLFCQSHPSLDAFGKKEDERTKRLRRLRGWISTSTQGCIQRSCMLLSATAVTSYQSRVSKNLILDQDFVSDYEIFC